MIHVEVGAHVKMVKQEGQRWSRNDSAYVLKVRHDDVLIRFSGGHQAYVLPSEVAICAPPKLCPHCHQRVSK